MVHDRAEQDVPQFRSVNAVTPAMQQAIDAAVYACELRGLRANSIDMRDALEAALPLLMPKPGENVTVVLRGWGPGGRENHSTGAFVRIELHDR